MRQGITQFLYCCPTHFAKKFKLVSKSIKKQKGTLLSLNEEVDFRCSSNSRKEEGFHRACMKYNHKDLVSRCTITYEIPKGERYGISN